MSNESTNSSNSSSNFSNSSTYHNLQNSSDDESDHRYERRRQANRLVDRMMDEFIMSNPIEFFQMIHQVARAPRTVVEREREDGHNCLWNDYVSNQPTTRNRLISDGQKIPSETSEIPTDFIPSVISDRLLKSVGINGLSDGIFCLKCNFPTELKSFGNFRQNIPSEYNYI